MVTALRDLCSWRLRPLLQWLLLTLKGYIRVSVLVRSPLKHTFFSFNADGQMVFRARLAVEKTWPADTKGVDVTCSRRHSETFWAECSVSRTTRLCYKHLVSSVFFFCFCFFYSSSLSASHIVFTLSKFTSLSLLLIPGLQGDILTVIRRVDEHWIEAKLGDKVGVCPLQFTEVSSC